MVYEVRFQTVDPERRGEYVKMYKQAIQEIQTAGCKGGLILRSEDDPASVLVLLEWPSKEHHLRWRGTPPHSRFSRRCGRLADEAQHGRLLCRRHHLSVPKTCCV